MFRLLLASIATLLGLLAGCSTPQFDGDAIKGLLEGSPIDLSGEQVTLTSGQVDCGVQEDLWDAPNGNIARLEQKGRDLKFSDDVRMVDPSIPVPYTQISGSFPVSVSDVSRIRDTGSGTKLADVKLGVAISDGCFTSPLPLMGIRKGQFSVDAPVVFQFKGSGTNWTLDKLVH